MLLCRVTAKVGGAQRFHPVVSVTVVNERKKIGPSKVEPFAFAVVDIPFVRAVRNFLV